MPEALISDSEAMRQIQEYMNRWDWNSETMEDIAEIVRSTGREVRDAFFAGSPDPAPETSIPGSESP
jgi:hypothetical protein